MRAHELLNEVAAEDLLPKTFAQFQATWLPHIDRQDLYVNFNDHVSGPDTKTFSAKPNHGDPIGLYAYPLEYVLNHPTDIIYGRQARFLRVIQDTASNKILLQQIDQSRAVDLLSRMGAEDAEMRFKALRGRLIKAGWGAGDAINGKTFFQMMQYSLHPGQKTRLTNAEQTAVLRRAGIDALEDRARGEQDAVIYRDEPEQIVFLSRSAFRVIDSFVLRSEAAGQLSKVNPVENMRRLPVLIAHAIGDRIVNVHTASDESHEQTSYTAAKRKIVVRLHAQTSFAKGHRGGDIATREPITVRLMGVDFEPIVQEFTGDATFTQIAAAIGNLFKNRKPSSGNEYDRDIEHGVSVTRTMGLLRQVATKLRVAFDVPQNPNLAHMIYSLMRHVDKIYYPYRLKDFTTKAFIPAVEASLGRLSRRPVQADQLIAIWNAAVKNKRITSQFKLHLGDFAAELGIASEPLTVASEHSVGFREEQDGVILERVGDKLMLTISGTSFEAAKIDNNKLEKWSLPPQAVAASVLKAAGAIARFLNKHSFYVEGYIEWLAQHFDLVFRDKAWTTVQDSGEVVNLPRGLAVITIPKNKDESVVMLTVDSAALAAAEKPAPNASSPRRGAVILFWTRGRNITSLSVETRDWLRSIETEKKPADGQYHGAKFPYSLAGYGSQGNKDNLPVWEAIIASGFSLDTFIREQGYHPSSALGNELNLFGLMANQDNDKVGKTVRETLRPVGTYGGLEIFSFRGSPASKLGQWRRFIIKNQDKLVEIARCDTDYHDGKTERKVEWINPDLTPEQKVATQALLAEKQLGIPVKLRPLLKIDTKAGSKRVSAPASVG